MSANWPIENTSKNVVIDDLCEEHQAQTSDQPADLEVDGLETSLWRRLIRYLDPENK